MKILCANSRENPTKVCKSRSTYQLDETNVGIRFDIFSKAQKLYDEIFFALQSLENI